ncbi:CotH kinase family protein [Balneolales bacterium ANBcel1]|nr:CotH kinase family protein [Balneolales bacterium ANBcel1]
MPILLLLLPGLLLARSTGSEDPARGNAKDVVINEIQASNNSTLPDNDGDYEDWIELYNAGASTAYIGYFGLSDDHSQPYRWIFPAGTKIPPGEYLLIWASGKDRATPGKPLHTNFAIAREGEGLVLTDIDGNLIDKVPPTPIPSDLSFGRQPDGSDTWRFFQEPTPGACNTAATGYNSILNAPEAHPPGGFHAGKVTVNLSGYPGDAEVRYTLDGSEPTADSPLYDGPVIITDRSEEPNDLSEILDISHRYAPAASPEENVYKGTVLRARAFREGDIAGPAMTETYFIHDDGADRYSFAVINLSTDPDHLFGHENGIYVLGRVHEEWIEQGGRNFNGGAPANYNQRGRGWERPAHMVMFDEDGNQVVSQDIGIRIHGGWSRAFPQKSFRLYSRSDYGESRFRYRFFPDLELDDFNRLILRQSGQDVTSTMFRDIFIQESVGHMQFDIQHYRPAILFLNGEYWGIYNIRQRYDRHYIETHYDVGEDELDLLTRSAETPKEGDNTDYLVLRGYINSRDMSEPEHYEYVKQHIDTDNLIDYFIAQIYSDNRDWPHNNIDFWRMNHGEYRPDSSIPEQDGRWRWLMFDTDWGFGWLSSINNNTLDRVTGDGREPWANLVFDGLMDNRSFRNRFMNRFADMLNTAFLPERLHGLLDSLEALYAVEIAEHIARRGHAGNWEYPMSKNAWRQEVAEIRDFAEGRPAFQMRHLMRYDNRDTIPLLLDVTTPGKGHIQVNSIAIDPSTPGVGDAPWPWSGTYFRNIPVQLSAVPEDGFEFARWVSIPPEQPPDSTGKSQNSRISDDGEPYGTPITISTDPSLTLPMTEPVRLAAEFREEKTPTGIPEEQPDTYALHQNYPNPFNPQTHITFTLPVAEHVVIDVYDITGRHITRLLDEQRSAGRHQITFGPSGGTELASGIYLYRMEAGKWSETKRMTLIK